MEKKSTYKGFTDSRKKANAKYIKEKTEPITLRVSKGKKENIINHAEKQNESLNAFINRAIDEAIERDNK